MRIDDSKRVPYEPLKTQQRAESTTSPTPVATPSDVKTEADVTRADRIEKLKEMFQADRPIDVNKLADKLLESGIFFNEKA